MEKELMIPPFLLRDELHHIDMIEAIRRGCQKTVAADEGGVLIYDPESEIWLITAKSPEDSRRLLAIAGTMKCVCAHQDFTMDQLREDYELSGYMDCFAAAYLKRKPLDVPLVCEFRELTPDWAGWVREHYEHDNVAMDYIQFLLESGVMVGAFIEGECAGFIGRHSDGEIGLLTVLPEYRRRGIGGALSRDAVNRDLSAGHVPFGEIETWNDASIRLHKALDMEFSEGHLYWADLTPKHVTYRFMTE